MMHGQKNIKIWRICRYLCNIFTNFALKMTNIFSSLQITISEAGTGVSIFATPVLLQCISCNWALICSQQDVVLASGLQKR